MDTNNKTVEELNELLYKKNENVTFRQEQSSVWYAKMIKLP